MSQTGQYQVIIVELSLVTTRYILSSLHHCLSAPRHKTLTREGVDGIYCNASVQCPVSSVNLYFMLPATPDLHPGHYTGDNGENIARVI